MEYFLPIWIQNFRENHAMNKDYDKNDSFLLENKERNGELTFISWNKKDVIVHNKSMIFPPRDKCPFENPP